MLFRSLIALGIASVCAAGPTGYLNSAREATASTSSQNNTILRMARRRRFNRYNAPSAAMKILLFDIDGTLINAGSGAKRAFDSAFSALFGILPVTSGVTIHGSTDLQIHEDIANATLRRSLNADESDRLNTLYVEHLRSELNEASDFGVIMGVRELMSMLHGQAEFSLGIQTGNLEHAGTAKLQRANLESFFRFGGYGSDGRDRAEIIDTASRRAQTELKLSNIELQDVTVIGDAPQDVRAAKKVGVRAIAVTTGIYSTEQLMAENPYCVLPKLTNQ